MKYLTSIPVLLLVAAAAPAQELRHGVAAADLVVAGKVTAAQPVGEHFLVHHLQVERTLKGDATTAVSIVEIKGVSLHQRPVPGELRLYCLQDFSAKAADAGLPARLAPYFRMVGYLGSNPALEDTGRDPAVRLAEIIIAAERGAPPRDVRGDLCQMALHSPAPLRTEAVEALTERPTAIAALDPLQLSQLTSRAVGETEDLSYKLALMQLCAERKVPHLIENVCLAAADIEDPGFWRTLGALARRLHGEQATDVLRPLITGARDADVRGRLLLALGATSTESALDALLRMRAAGSKSHWVIAALEAHGSRRAIEATKK